MRKSITLILIGMASVFFMADVYSQSVTIDGVFRPRTEFRHGYKNIFPEFADAAFFTSQRSRLGLTYADDKFKIGFNIQNVGVWGETGTLSKSDVYGTAVHEAWGEILFSKKVSLKLGRQEIIYDDHRIFGNVDWTQQARSHDAAILKYNPDENNQFEFGAALNAMGESLTLLPYMQNNYKAIQFAHWHGKFNNIGISFLALNNGMPWINQNDKTGAGNARENVAYSQTIGPRFSFNNKKISGNAAFYLQTGKRTILDTTDKVMNLSAYYFALDGAFAVSENFSIGAGLEYLSGNDQKAIADDLANGKATEQDKAFTPFYGTNHKFNGWMDYFYVGNHIGSIGLMDIFIPVKYKKDKFSAAIIPHFFSSAGTLYQYEKDENFMDKENKKEYSKGLGTEIDLTIGYAISKSALFKAGVSNMFATESMEVLRGIQSNTGNSWGWVMIIFKPTFYQSK